MTRRSIHTASLALAAGLAMTLTGCATTYQDGAIGEQLTNATARFHADATAKSERLPSLALVSPLAGRGPVSSSHAVRPVFSTDDEGRSVTTIATKPGTSLYGAGQVAGELQLNGRILETWNLDAYSYQDGDPNLYTSHPWVLAVREDGSAYGVLADSTFRVEMDLRSGIRFTTAGPRHPVLIIEGDTPQDVVKELGKLTGTIEMPPKWAIGYHQCRYSYNPESRVREVAETFRERNIPADVIWMDIDYMNEYRVFTFDDSQFPDPRGLNDYLDTIGFSNVWMINPGVKNEDGFFVHDQGDQLDAWVKTASGEDFVGKVWPGDCVFPDYTNKDVRTWWAGLYKDYMAENIDGVWNDMNEPSVFDQPTKTMPEDNWHRADAALGGPGPHAQYHNVYGTLMVKASREGIMAANPDKRPFVLSRSGYIGGHRYGATWTGDNTSSWSHLDISIPMTLNLGLSGQPFAGPDLGGFIDNSEPGLYARWFGFGSLLPFARGHTQKANEAKEPWSYGPEVEATVRRALERRYRLIPHLYTLFYESHKTGMPVAQPVFFADPADPRLRSVDDAFMLGENLIVAADTQPDRTSRLVLPENTGWVEFDFEGFDGQRDSEDPDQAKLFLRKGGIVATAPVHQYFGDRPDQRDEVTLLIALNELGEASGELYEDAGEGWGFKEGEYLHTRYTAKMVDGKVEVLTERIGGEMPRPDRRLRARVLLGDGEEMVIEDLDGRSIARSAGR